MELKRRDRELTAENEKIATQIAADVRKNAKTIGNVKKCLEVHVTIAMAVSVWSAVTTQR